MGALEKETFLLGRLCTLMENAFFQGSPPPRDFYSRFLTLLCGQLEFDRDILRMKKYLELYDVLEGSHAPSLRSEPFLEIGDA